MTRGVFVTGTDTGVGKTVVSCALVRQLCERGLQVGVMKPCETGVGPEGPLDALALRAAAGSDDALAEICPVQLAMPAAPNVAALAERTEVPLDAIEAGYRTLAERHDFMVVEGAGGLLVPVRPPFTMADLAARLGLPVLLVIRTALGTINHTLLTLSELDRQGLPCVGVVASHATGPLSEADQANFAHLREQLGDRLVGEIPPLAPGQDPEPTSLRVDVVLDRL